MTAKTAASTSSSRSSRKPAAKPAAPEAKPASVKATKAKATKPTTTVVEPEPVAAATSPKGFSVAAVGTIDGRPARIRVSRSAAVMEVEGDDGEYHEHHSTTYGGKSATTFLVGYLDAVGPTPTEPIRSALKDAVKIETARRASAASTVAGDAQVQSDAPAAVALPNGDSDALATNAAIDATRSAAPVVETTEDVVAEVSATAPVEPVNAPAGTSDALASIASLNDLDEVRAALDVEARGACRATVIRALKVRAGEIILGVSVSELARKSATKPTTEGAAKDEVVERLQAAIRASGGDSDTVTIGLDVLAAAGFPAWAVKTRNYWRADRPGAKAARALGYASSVAKRGETSSVVLRRSSATSTTTTEGGEEANAAE